MGRKKHWFLLIIPNLVLWMAQGVPASNPARFDESYLSKDRQLWIKYEAKTPRRFQGVLATEKEQKTIWGFRENDFFFFWSEDSAWTAELFSESNKCEPSLRVSHWGKSLSNFVLHADYCDRIR